MFSVRKTPIQSVLRGGDTIEHAKGKNNIIVLTTSLKNSKSNGATSVRKFSNAGWFSIHSPKRGIDCFKELISVRDDMKAMGTDQKKHSTVEAAMEAKRPPLLALCGSPTFLQKMACGSGAGKTSMQYGLE
jgi:hypothetical protein